MSSCVCSTCLHNAHAHVVLGEVQTRKSVKSDRARFIGALRRGSSSRSFSRPVYSEWTLAHCIRLRQERGEIYRRLRARRTPHAALVCLWTIKPRHLFIRFAAEILCETNRERGTRFSLRGNGALGGSANDLRKKAAPRCADRRSYDKANESRRFSAEYRQTN